MVSDPRVSSLDYEDLLPRLTIKEQKEMMKRKLAQIADEEIAYKKEKGRKKCKEIKI